ncbi:MAG: hypothetical protein U1F52_21595 [Burkholderiales bacterium]
MAETNSIPTPTPTAVTQSTYEKQGTPRPWPMRSTLDVKFFVEEREREHIHEKGLTTIGLRLYLDDRREVVGVVDDNEKHDTFEWINGWSDTYPCGRVAILRQITREALRFDATGVILVTCNQLGVEQQLTSATHAARQIAETLGMLGIRLLDIGILLIDETPSGFEMVSIFNAGRWGDGTGADRVADGATLQ